MPLQTPPVKSATVVLAPLLAGALVLLGLVLWPHYRLPDTVNHETVATAGLLPAKS